MKEHIKISTFIQFQDVWSHINNNYYISFHKLLKIQRMYGLDGRLEGTTIRFSFIFAPFESSQYCKYASNILKLSKCTHFD
jgi:hypothetical protein